MYRYLSGILATFLLVLALMMNRRRVLNLQLIVLKGCIAVVIVLLTLMNRSFLRCHCIIFFEPRYHRTANWPLSGSCDGTRRMHEIYRIEGRGDIAHRFPAEGFNKLAIWRLSGGIHCPSTAGEIDQTAAIVGQKAQWNPFLSHKGDDSALSAVGDDQGHHEAHKGIKLDCHLLGVVARIVTLRQEKHERESERKDGKRENDHDYDLNHAGDEVFTWGNIWTSLGLEFFGHSEHCFNLTGLLIFHFQL